VRKIALLLLVALFAVASARAEAMLQYFNTDWREITARIPELAEAGYNSLWVPPPTKGSGGLSVGYDLFDRFDIGGKEQRGTVRTRYGTETDLHVMIETAHRFGIRVYFDNIMNHNSFDVPGFNASTPIDVYPGFVPEDFHLRVTEDGFYRKWDNTRDWNSAWQVQNLGLADLIDIAHESPNTNHGRNEGDDMPKLSFVRHPNNPDYYLDTDLPLTVSNSGGSFTVYTFANKEPWEDTGVAGVPNSAGNGRFDFVDTNGNGQHDLSELSEPFTDTGVDPATPSRQTPAWGFNDGKYNMGNPVVEDVNALLIRAARWLVDRTRVDGYRLDAVKHVPDYFFGQMSGADKDKSSAGYLGQSQEQFNITRGYSDWDNHRDSVFDTEVGRDDAMMFGEHLGQPPGFNGYWDSGMRLVDNDLRNELNNRLGNPSNSLQGLDQPGAGGFAASLGVTHAQSHDNDYAARRELQHAYYFTRAGLPLVYTDGNNHAGTLSQSGGAFPRLANTNFLGQYNDGRLPNLAYVHNHFARGDQVGRFADADFVAYERIDKRENGGMTDADGVTMLFMMNDNYANGQARSFTTAFPATAGGSDAYLFNYSTYGGGFYTYASALNSMVVPPGGYFVFGWRSPEGASGWTGAGGNAITIQQNGVNVGTVTVDRKDGRDGDKAFNPYNLPDANATDYKYSIALPRVTNGANLRFIARADASAENILMSLDGGVDINSHIPLGPTTGDKRDRPPAISTDTFVGYEQPQFIARQYGEKFAAINTTNNKFGSAGATTYITTIGSGVVTSVNSTATNDFSDDGGRNASFFYHDADENVGGIASPPLQYSESGSAIAIWGKPNGVGIGYRAFIYYTTDGTNPEGAGGVGLGTTKTVAMNFQHVQASPPGDWWKGEITPKPSGQLRYKLGIYKDTTDGATTTVGSVFPSGAPEVDRKKRGMTTFHIPNFNATTAKVRTHNDYSEERTGLAEGFHVLRARAFLNRNNRASIYNTWTQTFYYDTQTPGGEIKFPAGEGDTVGGQQYGCVVRTDASVTEVWVHIDDGDATNDDAQTGGQAGNGAGPEPFTDANGNGVRDATEVFTDINGNGVFDPNLSAAWMKVSEVSPSLNITSPFAREWRFNYRNIPASGSATIKVRLLEVSSSRNLGLAAASAHVTELTRMVNCAGPNLRMFIAYPQQDGQNVGEGYVIKVRFTDSLANGLTETQLRNRFVVEIASDESGSLSGAVVQTPQTLPIIYNSTPGFHDYAFALPNLYNGVPDFLHTIRVRMNRPSPDPDLETTREVRAEITQPAVFMSVNNPPEFDSDGKKYEIVLPAVPAPTPDQRSFTIEVETGSEATGVAIAFEANTATATLISDDIPNPRIEGNHKFWRFLWSNMVEGPFTFTASAQTDADPEPEATVTRNATVVFRQIVAANEADEDDDEDGLGDLGEATITALPTGNPETWTNGQVHVHHAYGQSFPLSPDTDGDGLPDGLEVGWRTAANPPTNPATDTDGDGFKNFIGDLDPPFYNTIDNVGKVPGVNTLAEGGDRSQQRAGSVTNPNNPDSDGDGIEDGVEDSDRNGWTNGDGASLATNANPTLARAWPNNKMDAGETWLETSPTKADSDVDGLSDGFGEDKDFDGGIAGDADNDRSYDVGELWTETDPLKADTDGDGLPDGWETQNGLDPLDNGTDSFRTAAAADGDPAKGASGDPDGDLFSNLQELTNGTDPNTPDTGVSPPANSIVIGPQTPVTIGGVTHAKEFTDWTIADLIALDEYDGDGPNNRGSDVYHRNDGFDSSRDIVAFYAHDGGAVAGGGDGNFYFRIDVRDLKAFAEDGGLDAYVVIDTGNPASGEYALPDQVDVATDMKWEAVVAVYSANNGRVYVDTQNANNSVSLNQNPLSFGVVARDQNAANGFKKAYYDSGLDAVEFSISRQALLDAGWNGLNAAQLNYQVFTTKDGTANSPVGPGDIGGRNDICDTITDDFLASDYYADQGFISQAVNAVLRGRLGANATNDRGQRAKVISIIHGNQAIVPGSNVQALINNTAGAGFYRPIDAHEAYAQPAALHITATLASAIQWAKVDPNSSRQYRDGPALNTRIKTLAQSGVVGLLGSTFSDHVLDYFSPSFNASNIGLANEFLGTIYGNRQSTQVLWNPERVANHATLNAIAALGYDYTFIDQMRHLTKWFGRNSALGNDGYRINEINGVKCFVINDQASGYRFTNTDNGLATSLRDLLHRKARAGGQDQVVILFSNWEDFADKAKADAYDKNIRWLANHPWTQLVTPDQIANGEVDLSQPPDGVGDAWGVVSRGTQSSLVKTAHDFIDHATQESYDNWFNGQSGREESLRDKRFDIRTGVQLPVGKEFGSVALGTGVSGGSWTQVIATEATGLSKLARGTAGAAAFETAFHTQSNNDLSKFSTGAYVSPDTSFQNLAGFAKVAQSQFRFAAVFQRVDTWAAAAAAGDYNVTAVTEVSDVDLDGEDERLLFNDRVFALFERIGGRMTGAWVRDIHTGEVFQVTGNFLSYAGSESEVEGATNITGGAVNAHRMSGFRDQFAQTGGSGVGTTSYVNDLYSAALAPSGTGWVFTSGDGKIAKTITLSPRATHLRATYALSGDVNTLFVRFGLSPNLHDLLLHGQANLATANDAAHNEFNAYNQNATASVRAFVRYGSGTSLQSAAVDRDSGTEFDTINMRNLAQTHQVEVFGGHGMSFSLGLQTGSTISADADGDGLPDWWESLYGLDPDSADGDHGSSGDPDADGKTNAQEFLINSNPAALDFIQPTVGIGGGGPGTYTLSFPTARDRLYRIYFTDNLAQPFVPIAPDIPGFGAVIQWTDNGSQTGGLPTGGKRFYKIEVRLPQPE